MRCPARSEQLANGPNAVQFACLKLGQHYNICLQALDEAKGVFDGSPGGMFWQEHTKTTNKAVLKVDVNCTPISALDELLKQLDGPCIPTFKLKDLARLSPHCFIG